ncbi:MAG: tRNA (5-methylaminomethyl-2-thiouridine)(34)-methyltransferase MnmD [Saprospiraceae bacterium]
MHEILDTHDGSHTLLSQQHGVTYHSKYGAITETNHVFIEAALRFKAAIQQDIRILEIGFGTGLNAYATLLDAVKRNLKIVYTTYEAFPISEDQAASLNYHEQLEPEMGNSNFMHLHQLDWNQQHFINENFQFQKINQTFQTINDTDLYDIIYFDAFAPESQPELWNEELLAKMFAALKTGGLLTTYCAKGVVKRTFKKVGFTLETLQGPPGKREMIRVSKE